MGLQSGAAAGRLSSFQARDAPAPRHPQTARRSRAEPRKARRRAFLRDDAGEGGALGDCGPTDQGRGGDERASLGARHDGAFPPLSAADRRFSRRLARRRGVRRLHPQAEQQHGERTRDETLPHAPGRARTWCASSPSHLQLQARSTAARNVNHPTHTSTTTSTYSAGTPNVDELRA
jgi:hypothetical protein